MQGAISGESLDLDAGRIIPEHLGLYYGGAWHDADGGQQIETRDPSNGTVLAAVDRACATDVDRAVAAASAAFPGWAAKAPAERARVVREIAQIARAHGTELATLDSLDSGNPLTGMLFDITLGTTFLDFFAGLATEVKGETIPVGAGKLNYVVREPLGVVARIIPFNHPIMFVLMKMGAPLIAGNTLIMKPSEHTPLSALRLMELIGDVVPPGVLNIVNGDAEAGEALATHPDVASVSVIGSVPTGRAVMRSAASTVKSVLLELGGKNAMIAYPDSDPAKVADSAVAGMNFGWTGSQSCGATSRIFVHEDIHDQVVDHVGRKMSDIKLGAPSDAGTEMGCLTNRALYNRVLGFIDDTVKDGARLIAGGGPPDEDEFANGFFVRPTAFADVTAQMRLAREEVFGPVMAILKWSDEAEMLTHVNGVDYGLTCSIWTRDLSTAHRTAAAVKAGYVWINGASTHILGAPFGGFKQSGIGREECLDEVLAFTQTKNVNVTLEP